MSIENEFSRPDVPEPPEDPKSPDEDDDFQDGDTRNCDGCDNIQRDVVRVGKQFLCKMCRTPEDDWRQDR